MKTYINSILIAFALALIVLGITSCEDALNVTPKDRTFPANYFKNEAELQMFSNEFYMQFPGESDIIREATDQIAKNDMSDELRGSRIIPANESTGSAHYKWKWDQLRDINTLLEYSVNCSDRNIRNQYNALARFFRAYFYFEKVKRYGDVPWYDEQLYSNSPDLKKPRDSREFIMAKIIEDLDFANLYLPPKKELYRVTKWTALALKSRVCLFEGTFRKYHGLTVDGVDHEFYLQEAVKASEEFISQSGYGLYQAEKSIAYRDLFASLDARGEEIILARNFNKGLGVAHNANFYTVGSSMGRPGLTKRAVNSYLMMDGSRFTEINGYENFSFVEECKNRDPRLAQTIRTPGYMRVGTNVKVAPDLLTSSTGYQPIKYVLGTKYDGPNTESECDLPLFRTAEVYLNLAEAKAELGTLTQADLDRTITKIRDRVGMPKLVLADANATPDPYLMSPQTGYPQVSGSNTGVILEIRRERGIELIMEGFRYYDMMRWKEGKTFECNYFGLYFPSLGFYDLDGDGKNDICLYKGTKPAGSATLFREVGKEMFLSDGESGYVVPYHNMQAKWDETRDYLYPIPRDERLLTGGNLKQNPGWNDGLNF